MKASRKRTVYDVADENFSQIGTIVAAMQSSTDESESKRYAKMYKLIIVCTLAEDTRRQVDKELIEEKGKSIGVQDLYELFHNYLPQLRNLLADHWHRMKEKHYLALMDALIDFNLLERLHTGHAASSSTRLKRPLTNLITFINEEIPKIKKRSVSYVERSQKIIFYLEKSLAIVQQDPSILQEETAHAVALLHIAAGTCARELLAELEAREPQLDKNLAEHLLILKIIRDGFAHERALQGIELIRKEVGELQKPVSDIIQELHKQIPAIQRILGVIPLTGSSIPTSTLLPASGSGLTSTATILQSLGDSPAQAAPLNSSANLAGLTPERQIVGVEETDPLELFYKQINALPANETASEPLSGTEIPEAAPEQQSETLTEVYKPL